MKETSKFTNLEKRKNEAVYQSLDIVKAIGKGGGVKVNGVIFPCLFKMELSSFALCCSYLVINHRV